MNEYLLKLIELLHADVVPKTFIYAAMDSDGEIWVYRFPPYFIEDGNGFGGRWKTGKAHQKLDEFPDESIARVIWKSSLVNLRKGEFVKMEKDHE